MDWSENLIKRVPPICSTLLHACLLVCLLVLSSCLKELLWGSEVQALRTVLNLCVTMSDLWCPQGLWETVIAALMQRDASAAGSNPPTVELHMRN